MLACGYAIHMLHLQVYQLIDSDTHQEGDIGLIPITDYRITTLILHILHSGGGGASERTPTGRVW